MTGSTPSSPTPPSATGTASGASAAGPFPTLPEPTPAAVPPAPPDPTGLSSDPSDAGGTVQSAAAPAKPAPVILERIVRKNAKARREASARGGKAAGVVRRARRPYRKIDAREAGAIAVLRAAGMNDHETSRALQLAVTTVNRAAKSPDILAQIQRWRELFKAQALERAQEVQDAAWHRVADALNRDDAKAFDAYTRGLAAMERTAASASGENKPQSLNVNVGVQTVISPEERAELLAAWRASVVEAEGERG